MLSYTDDYWCCVTKDLYDVYGEETVTFLKEKARLKDSIDDMQTTCKLTDIVLENNNVEMLLLKREIEERLGVILVANVQELPGSISQRVKVSERGRLFQLKTIHS